MRKKTVAIILLAICISLCGVLILAISWTDKIVYVYAHDFESSPGVRLMDPNHAIFEIISLETNHVNVKMGENRDISSGPLSGENVRKLTQRSGIGTSQ
jgi:hypothetical protein